MRYRRAEVLAWIARNEVRPFRGAAGNDHLHADRVDQDFENAYVDRSVRGQA
jgi:hypothetical protein